MCITINEGDLVAITCEEINVLYKGEYVKKCDDCHVVLVNDVIKCFKFYEWEVEKI